METGVVKGMMNVDVNGSREIVETQRLPRTENISH